MKTDKDIERENADWCESRTAEWEAASPWLHFPEGSVRPEPKKPSDPLVRAVKKAYRSSPVYELDQLLAEETRWKRKLTIASNKLEAVRRKINRFAEESVKPKTE